MSEPEERLVTLDFDPPSQLPAGVNGRPEPEPVPNWARAGSAAPLPERVVFDAGQLQIFFPRAWETMGQLVPKDAPDSLFANAAGLLPSEQWRHFRQELRREEHRLRQLEHGNLVTSGSLSGNAKPVASPCRLCGTTSSALDASKACFGGCSA